MPGTMVLQHAEGSRLLLSSAGLVAALGLAGAVLWKGPEGSTAMFKRSGALVQACQAAGAEITALRLGSFLVDDCSTPTVTPLLNKEGRLIVSRTLRVHLDGNDGKPTTYSLKMDGRGFDGWRVLEVRRAPNQLSFDVSLLAAARSTGPTTTQRE